MEKQESKLKLGTMYAYALSIFGFGILISMNTFYTNFYLTDVAVIPVATIASLLLVCRIGDMVMVPIVGGILEKTNLKWGKYRSWLLVGPLFLAVFYTLIYTNFNMSVTAKLIYFAVVYLIAHLFVNLVYGVLYALIPLMAKTNYERSKLSAARAQMQALGTIVFGYIAMPLLLMFTGNGAKKPGAAGFTATTALFGVVMIITFLIAFKATKNFDLPQIKQAIAAENNTKKSKISSKDMAKLLFTNPHILALIVADTLRLVASFGFSGVLAYYFIYVLKNLPMFSVFLGTLSMLSFGVAVIFPFISKIVDKRTIYIAGCIIVIASQLCAWAFAKNTGLFIGIIVFHYIGHGLTTCASPAMYADATDYSENIHGKDGKGFLMSMANLPPKIGLIITGSLTALILSAIGYKAGIAATPEIVSGIKNLTHFMPAGAYVLALAVIVLFNKLTVSKVQEIQKEISEKSN